MVKVGLIAKRRYKGKKRIIANEIEYYISYINKNVTTEWKTKTEKWFTENEVSSYLCQQGLDIDLKLDRYKGEKWFAHVLPTMIKKIIRHTQSSRTRLVFIDKALSDDSCECIMKSAESARYITIVTDNKQKAEQLAEKVYSELGLLIDTDVTEADFEICVNDMTIQNKQSEMFAYSIKPTVASPVPTDGIAFAEFLWKSGIMTDNRLINEGNQRIYKKQLT